MPQFASIRRAIHYSRHILVGRLCWAAYNDSDFVIAGRVLGTAPLGAYTLAWTLAHTPLEKLTALMNRVTPSVFAKIQNEPQALRRYLLNITGGMALVIFPATIGLALVAPDLVAAIFGSKWNQAIVPLQLLALHALIRSNVILLSPILNVIGEERLVMWNSAVALLVLPATFYIGSHWSTVGIAAGWVVVYPVTQVRLFLRIFRRLNLPASDYWKSLWPAISGTTVMALALAIQTTLSFARWPLPVRLASEVVAGIASYGLVLALWHRSYLREIAQFVRTTKIKTA